MKTITYEDFDRFKPWWLIFEECRQKYEAQFARYRAMRDKWSAIDILRLDGVNVEDLLWLVLREELIDAPILHEFSCRCAERALSRIDKPDERSIAAIEAKRKWLRGEISDKELAAAWDAARSATWAAAGNSVKHAAWAAARDAAWSSTCPKASSAAWCAAKDAERCAAMEATWYAERKAKSEAGLDFVLRDARSEARLVEREWQISELMRMLEEQE